MTKKIGINYCYLETNFKFQCPGIRMSTFGDVVLNLYVALFFLENSILSIFAEPRILIYEENAKRFVKY